MPAKYDAIKQELLAKGVSLKSAERSAARIYNAGRSEGQRPVTRNYDAKTDNSVTQIPKPKQDGLIRPKMRKPLGG